jgi:acyl-CoA thioesterase FadM
VEGRAGLKRHKVVWGEMDSMGHVNNVTYVRYAETGRVEWVCNLGSEGGKEEGERWRELMTPKGERGLILKSIKVDYKFVSIPMYAFA